MKEFTTKDVENYYDQTEVHYRMFWKLEKSLGLHYGVWDDHTRSLDASIMNTNALLMEMGAIEEQDLSGIAGRHDRHQAVQPVPDGLLFSRIHYKTGLAQYRTYRKKQWGYHLLRLEKKG